MNKADLPPSETRFDDLVGVVAVNFKENEDFNSLASQITGYDPLRFEPVALRVFAHEHNPVVTIYAVDKEEKGLQLFNQKLKVKKFKMEMSFDEILQRFKYFKFTLASKEYKLEDMEVVD